MIIEPVMFRLTSETVASGCKLGGLLQVTVQFCVTVISWLKGKSKPRGFWRDFMMLDV